MRSILYLLLMIIITAGICAADGDRSSHSGKTAPLHADLPHTTLVVWDEDRWTVEKLKELRSIGIQGVAKIVNAGGWDVVEKEEGKFDFSRLESFLERARKAGLWVFPTACMNKPPAWFIKKYPSCLMKDDRGNTVVSYYSPDDGQVLSPWFMAGKTSDYYIRRYLIRLTAVLKKYPNVAGVFVGNEAAWIFNRPWRFGDAPDLTYFSCFDDYSLAAYRKDLASKYPDYPLPPKTYDDVKARGKAFEDDFERWYQSGAVSAIDKYLGWLDGRVKYKIVNVGRLGFPPHNYMLGTTDYQIKSVFSVMAKHPNVIENYEALDASDIVCGEMAKMSADAGLIFGGEPVGGGNLPLALKNLEANNGQMMIWIAFEEALRKMSADIIRFNKRFPGLPSPPVK
ncbi:MAG: beta-galactosidase [Armatimonadota bacterium]